MESILIRQVRLVMPDTEKMPVYDVFLENGKIAAVDEHLQVRAGRVIEGEGLCLSPGLVDIHTHMRDPGQTRKEDISTGSAAAAKGGFTAICAMPNTEPCCDNPSTVRYVEEKGRAASCRVYPVGCITRQMASAELCNFAALKKAGAVAVSDDGRCVESDALMQQGVVAAAREGLVAISHCEDMKIVNGGIINKGYVSRLLGCKGIDRASEDSITRREIAIAEKTGRPVHIAHVSTAGSFEAIRQAKARGVPVTCETAPHYFIFTQKSLLKKDANFRMNPPLRTGKDRKATLFAMADGTVDAIVTDHAPHTKEDKADFYKAPNGIIGLETSLAASYTYLVKPGLISLPRLISLMSASPARVLGLPDGRFAVGGPADLVLYDPAQRWTVRADAFASKSSNSPFIGMQLQCRVKYTIRGGEVVYADRGEA